MVHCFTRSSGAFLRGKQSRTFSESHFMTLPYIALQKVMISDSPACARHVQRRRVNRTESVLHGN